MKDFNLVVGDLVASDKEAPPGAGAPELLYIGFDATEAETAYREADDSFETVRLFQHLYSSTAIRFPAADAAMMAEQSERTTLADAQKRNETRTALNAAENTAKKAAAEAERLRTELAKLDPNYKPPMSKNKAQPEGESEPEETDETPKTPEQTDEESDETDEKNKPAGKPHKTTDKRKGK